MLYWLGGMLSGHKNQVVLVIISHCKSVKLKMINLQDTSNYISYLFDKAWVFLFPLLCFILRFLLSVHFDYDILRDSGCLSGVSFLKFAREIGSPTVRLDPLRMPDV